MRCCYRCSYCINWKTEYAEADGKYWVDNINRLETDLPVTLGGGEPSLHKDFYEIILGIRHSIDILTNLSFNTKEFIDRTPVWKFDDSRTFAPIRASFHPEFMDIEETVEKVRVLQKNGYRIGLYCVETDNNKKYIDELRKDKYSDIDFQTKPLLDNVVKVSNKNKKVKCRTKELILSPDGRRFRCHRDLYKKENSLGRISETCYIDYKFRNCNKANECHPCDIKIKRDRFGKEGYRAVELIYN